jgi:hypothetical protein
MRSQIDRLTEADSAMHRKLKSASMTAARSAGEINQQSSSKKAEMLREQVAQLLSKDSTAASPAEKPEVRRPRRLKGD